MRFIISPAKKMNETPDILEFQGYPEFVKDADILREYVAGLSYEEAKALWKCNDSIAELNFERFRWMDLRRNLTPAVMSYEFNTSIWLRRLWTRLPLIISRNICGFCPDFTGCLSLWTASFLTGWKCRPD